MSMPTWEAAPAAPRTTRRRVRQPRQPHHLDVLIRVVLRTPVLHRLVDDYMCELCFTDPTTARRVSVPLRYAHAGNDLIGLITMADTGPWWHAFQQPQPVQVLLHRRWYTGRGRILALGRPGWREARQVHTDRFPNVRTEDADLFVVVTVDDPAYPAG